MTKELRSDERAASLRTANEFLEFANDKLATGIHPMDVAAALRHAAANFTAFAYAHGTDDPLDTGHVVEEFLQLLENYDKRHRGEARPVTSLEKLVDQVKDE